MKRIRARDVELGVCFTPRMYWSDRTIKKSQFMIVVAKDGDDVTFFNIDSGRIYVRRYQPDENLCVLLRLVK